ncbi:MAG: T9SS type A sorting domain-containing protein [Crocinitomicaceae bacterium]|nr:T9SS type A sorting domain-containing protein [Crocinitomicaceae bacterium]NGF75565.1 T9SS type A sorting domain-containing protein [Fluviicola sp. SGL-29]
MKTIFQSLAKNSILFAVLALSFSFRIAAQCANPPYTSCSNLPGGSIQISPNSSFGMNSGIYYYSGGATTLSISYYNGGTLIICGGPVSINGFNPGGDVIITSGSSLIINGSVNLQNNNKIYNSGSLTINGNLTVNSNGIINNGLITVTGETRFNSGAKMCMGVNAALNSGSVYNDHPNSVTIPSGNACISYSGSFGGNNPVTNNAGLYICQGTTASDPSSIARGNATLVTNCTSCAFPLSVKLVSFELETAATDILLNWVTADERDVSYFLIEHAGSDGIFKQLSTVQATGLPNQENSYSFTDENKDPGYHYYRLSEVNYDGKVSILEIKSIELKADHVFKLFPNPTESGKATVIFYETANNGDTRVEFYTPVGNLVQRMQLNTATSSHEVSLPKGQYLVRLIENDVAVETRSLIVL